MKEYIKGVFRDITHNISRLISICVIILLGVAFVSGLGTLSGTIEDSYNQMFEESNIPDITIKCKSQSGFSTEEIDSFASNDEIVSYDTGMVADTLIDNKITRLNIVDLSSDIDKLTLKEGEKPSSFTDVLALKKMGSSMEQPTIGEEFTWSLGSYDNTFKVTGIVEDSMYFLKDDEPSLTDEDKSIVSCLYIDKNLVPSSLASFFPTTDIRMTLKNENKYSRLSSEYNDYVTTELDSIKSDMGENKYAYLTLEENKSFATLKTDCEKVDTLTFLFPAFFILVTALAVTTTTSRMITEDRSKIGCLKTQGLSNMAIVSKYLIYGIICCLIGISSGMALGFKIIPTVIFPAFEAMFTLPKMSSYIKPDAGIVSAILTFACVIISSLYVSFRSLRNEPATLLIPSSPKPGKKILLERIPFIWKKLSFKFKSSIRNIFRYKKKFWMTVISICGGTALVFAGFGVLNISDSTSNNLHGMEATLRPIAWLVILFSILLCLFVIYNLTNINIGERSHEIATLKVLGYNNKEVLTYIYREILIMALIGIIIGIPLGIGLISFLILYLKFGSLADIVWTSYIYSVLVIISSIALVDILLAKKILSIDMVSSLKSVD